MTKDLAVLVNEVAHTLDTTSSDVPAIDDVNRDENRILSAYIQAEWEENPAFGRYPAWNDTLFDPKIVKNPKKHMIRNREKVKKLYTKIDKFSLESGDDHFFDGETDVQSLSDLPYVLDKMIGVVEQYYSRVISETCNVASEWGRQEKPEDLMKDRSFRDEVKRRIIPTKEDYDSFQRMFAANIGKSLAITYSILDNTQEEVEEIRDVPVIGPMLKKYLDRRMSKVPPKNIMKEYLVETFEHAQREGERIYSEPREVGG